MTVSNGRGGVLEDIKVADFSQWVAGPLTARTLAEMGADVVHVEPRSGDPGRGGTTSFLGSEGFIHQIVNRSKRDLALDLHSAEGREVAERLIKWSDVVIESMKPGNFAKNGFTYQHIMELNPGAVYVSLSAYGPRGPLGQKTGYDGAIQGFAGLVQFASNGEAVPIGYVADTATPLLACTAILGALIERSKTGHGQMIDVSLLDGVLHMSSPTLIWVDDDPELSGTTSQPVRSPTIGTFEAGEGTYLMLVVLSDGEFRRLFDVIGLSEQGASPQYATRTSRSEHAEEIFGLLSGMLETRRAEEWAALLQEQDVPCSVVRLDRRELINEDQLWKNDMLTEIHHPTKGRIVQTSTGFRYSESPIGVRNPAPSLGLDSRSVLADLGYSQVEIADLVDKGRILVPEKW